ncbi:hypothetical protein P3T21_006783 [Paraburkholderia sp. GAS334]
MCAFIVCDQLSVPGKSVWIWLTRQPLEVEEITLRQLPINHRHRDARTRAAGLLQLGRKIKPKVIAEQLGVSDQSVYTMGS